jgi:hypothetical protein
MTVMAMGVAMHAILPILPMIAMCVLQSPKMQRLIKWGVVRGCGWTEALLCTFSSRGREWGVSKQRIEADT